MNTSDRSSPMHREDRYPEDLPIAHEVVRGSRKIIDAYPDRMMVGEAYLLDPGRRIAYYGAENDEFHLVFNFSFLNQPWSAAGFRAAIEGFESILPAGAWPDYTLSNHDHPRTVTRYGDHGHGHERARLAATMLLTIRGTPFLYYGEEIGMRDVDIPEREWLDPIGRDGCRTPMRWDSSPGAGFTSGEPWLPLGPGLQAENVAAQAGDPASMLSLYRRLIWFRKSSPALRGGAYRAVDAEGEVLVFLRESAGQRILVALNFSPDETTVRSPGVSGTGAPALSTREDRDAGRVDVATLRLSPFEGVIVVV